MATGMAPGNGVEAQRGPASSLVVMVDGDKGALKSLRGLLESNGFAVQAASSGSEALQILRESVPAVLILETEIPGMSGYDLCHIVKRDLRLQRVPVMFLTADGSPKSYRTGYDAGASAFVTKPYKPEMVVGMVNALARMLLPATE